MKKKQCVRWIVVNKENHNEERKEMMKSFISTNVTRLYEIIREQESEIERLKAELVSKIDTIDLVNKENHVLSKDNMWLADELERIKLNAMQEMDERDAWRRDAEKLKARLKPVEDVYEEFKDYKYDELTVIDNADIFDAVKKAFEKEPPDETKK